MQNGYVLNAAEHLLPQLWLSPFTAPDLHINRHAPASEKFGTYIQSRFSEYKAYFTKSGRHALYEALADLNLKPTDTVSIITTSGNFYISSCVTGEVEKFCTWDRAITEKTKVILLNHEFGFTHDNAADYKKYNLPIIEDCAYSFNSNNAAGTAGHTGDYVVFSMPKFFPVQTGGLLLSKNELTLKTPLEESEADYLKNSLGHHVDSIDWMCQKRQENYAYATQKFSDLGASPRFIPEGANVPGVFMFNLPPKLDAARLKTFFYRQGVECSVFYGEQAFFLPCHHKITAQDIDYFYEILKYFIHHSV